MINSDNFLLTSGMILAVLISATIISYTSKFIFVPYNIKKPANQMYDPDHSLNISHICVMPKNAHTTLYEKSTCFNKTLLQWYNPWLRHSLWTKFWNKIKARNRLKEMKVTQAEVNQTEEIRYSNATILPTDLLPEKKYVRIERGKEKPIEFVYSILFGLLVLSGIIACWEVCKDKLKRNAAAATKAQERQCSLADFTINRHLRRESQQQTVSQFPRQGPLEVTAKVTQNLIHQSSLDRAFPKTISEDVTSLTLRRNSVPLLLGSNLSATRASSGPILKLSKRQSVDVSGEEMSSDVKKKPRYFIRRH